MFPLFFFSLPSISLFCIFFRLWSGKERKESLRTHKGAAGFNQRASAPCKCVGFRTGFDVLWATRARIMRSLYTFIYLSISGYLLNYIFYINYNRTVSHFLSVAPSVHHSSFSPSKEADWSSQEIVKMDLHDFTIEFSPTQLPSKL